MEELQKYSRMLRDRNLSCIILKNGEVIYTSTSIGVRPLLLFLEEAVPVDAEDTLILVDKVIGKAALLLALKCGISRIYTPVLSREALDAAAFHGVIVNAEKVVPHIVNRTGDGKCPIEQSVTDTMDLEEAYSNIRKAIATLMKGKAEAKTNG